MRYEWTEHRHMDDVSVYPVKVRALAQVGSLDGKRIIAFRPPKPGETFYAGDRWLVAEQDFSHEKPRYIAEPQYEWVTDGTFRLPVDGEYIFNGSNTPILFHPRLHTFPCRCYRRIPKGSV